MALSDIEYTKQYVSEVITAKKLFCNYFEKKQLDIKYGVKKILKGFGNYILIQFKDEKSQMNFFNFLKSRNIYIRSLSHTNILKHCLRITIGTTYQMKLVLKELDVQI